MAADMKIAGASLGVQSSQVTVGDSVTALLPAGTKPLANRRSLYIFNNNAAGGAVLYVGGAAVTSAKGTPVPAQSGLTVDVSPSLTLYGICTTGNTSDSRLLELA